MIEALKVEQIFAGTNYLEEIAEKRIEDLQSSTFGGGNFIKGTPDSIFNKFSTFTYSNFIKGAAYDAGNHFIGYGIRDRGQDGGLDDANRNRLDTLRKKQADLKNRIEDSLRANKTVDRALVKESADTIQLMNQIKASAQAYSLRSKSAIANPTASNIIKWASEKSIYSVTGFQPYAMSDFVFCKYYGKIPNNRLITVRRYPFPMDDQLVPIGSRPPIPIAQAVTWWGGETNNQFTQMFSNILKWGVQWQVNTVSPQDVDGNEVLVKDVLGILKSLGPEGKADSLINFLEKAYVAYQGNDANLQQITGMEEKMQKYIRGLYSDTGPYWNRVLGPVNVIHQSLRRERGMQLGWDSEISINFHYSFRSFNGLSPRVVALDLISSFLNLTHMDAQFRGQLQRYFPKLGVKFDPAIGELLGDILTKYATSFDSGATADVMKAAELTMASIKKLLGDAVKNGKALLNGDTSGVKEFAAKGVQVYAMSALAKAVPAFISAKSVLSSRPIGEYHMVVGNPMNPIFVMGDLACAGASMTFDEEMGPDDFPTGVTFTIKLKQGKPRDKTAIERMFNLGLSKMMMSKIRNPSSTEDTMGPVNNKEFADLKKALSAADLQQISAATGYLEPNQQNSFVNYRNRLRRAYQYAKPSAVIDNKGKVDDSLLWLYFDRHLGKT